jgi:iron complex transport system substrate-binding protein
VQPGRLWPAAFVLPFVLLLSFIPACGGGGSKEEAATGENFPMSITQTDGQTLTISSKPLRLVSLDAHATEVFCAVGAGPQLVAVEKYANCPLGSAAKPELDAFQPNLEAIAGYRPDLVYVSSDSDGIVAALRRLNIPVLFLENPPSLDAVLTHIQTLANATGHAGEGRTLAGSMKDRMEAIRSKLASVTHGPRVFHELTNDYYTAAPNSFVGDLYTFLKAGNIAAGAQTAYPQLSAEVIVQRNPQVIVLADEDAGVTAASVRARPGWSTIDAVKNGRICIVDPDIVSRAGPRIVDALDALARCLYPDIFK